jgi:proline-specific peptidase
MEARETRVAVPGGNVWVRACGGGPGTPLLLLHGGPGVPGRYLEGLEVLGDERTVVRYDQLGCGRSDRPEDPGLWHLPRFVGELAAVRAALGLDGVVLHGHSSSASPPSSRSCAGWTPAGAPLSGRAPAPAGRRAGRPRAGPRSSSGR